ncbi:unnamed protein product [Prunus brigantina]
MGFITLQMQTADLYSDPLFPSIPRGSLVISTTFGKNDGSGNRIVIHQKTSLPVITSAPLKIKLKGHKAKKINVGLTVQNENGMLKVSLRRQ